MESYKIDCSNSFGVHPTTNPHFLKKMRILSKGLVAKVSAP